MNEGFHPSFDAKPHPQGPVQPAYTEFIGHQLLAHITQEVAA